MPQPGSEQYRRAKWTLSPTIASGTRASGRRLKSPPETTSSIPGAPIPQCRAHTIYCARTEVPIGHSRYSTSSPSPVLSCGSGDNPREATFPSRRRIVPHPHYSHLPTTWLRAGSINNRIFFTSASFRLPFLVFRILIADLSTAACCELPVRAFNSGSPAYASSA